VSLVSWTPFASSDSSEQGAVITLHNVMLYFKEQPLKSFLYKSKLGAGARTPNSNARSG
jgi:hypothetical protein